MKIIIFGVGRWYEKYKNFFNNMDIVALVDNSVDKQGCIVDGIVVDAPCNINVYEYDYVVIMSKSYKDMRNQLLNQNVDADKIIDAENRGIFSNCYCYTSYIVKSGKNAPQIIMFSHSMGYSGAPLMLLNAARILREGGYSIKCISVMDGPLRYEFMKNGVSVIICNDIEYDLSVFEDDIKNSSLVFVNTLLFYPYIDAINKMNTPILWWLHEEEDVYISKKYNRLEGVYYNNLNVYGVGSRVIEAYNKYLGLDNEIKTLYYGIDEQSCNKVKHHKIIFAMIGYVVYGKGEDVYIEAVNRINKLGCKEVEFWIIGEIENDKYEEYSKIENVKVFGCLEHEKMMTLYPEIDVLVCPSRNDSMPVVVTESMMMKRVCITSDHTGNASLISPYENGLVCKAGDVDDLVDKILWVKNNLPKLPEMGEQAYLIYKKYFSMEIFKKELLQIVRDIGRDS